MIAALSSPLTNDDLENFGDGLAKVDEWEKQYDGDPSDITFPHGTNHDPDSDNQQTYWNPGL